MLRRIYDSDGKEKDVLGGKVCSNGHFICADCVYSGFFGPRRTSCPLCNKPSR